jgi:hypothetical protein
MAVSFGSEITGDLASCEAREWLITNGLGSYGCGTVAGSLTRAYHGLLVAALKAPADPSERTLLVAALEEEARVGHRSYPLCTHRWAGGVLAPVGHPWISSFALEGSVPTWRYALGDALLEKRLWMRSGAHTTTVLYRLLQASQPVQLSLTVAPPIRRSGFRPCPMGCRWCPRWRGCRPLWCSAIEEPQRWPHPAIGVGALRCLRRRSGACRAATTICGPAGSRWA